MRSYHKLFIFFIICLFTLSSYARSGCCSHHGGVSHCDNTIGKYVCRDSTYSPTCLCPERSKQPDNSTLPDGGKLQTIVVEPKSTVPNNIKNLNSNIGEMPSEIDDIKSEIEDLRSEIESLKSRLNEIDALKSRIEDLRLDIDKLKSNSTM